MRRDNGMERVEFLPLRGAAAGEDLRAGQRQVADAGSLAGPVAEPSGRSEGACAPLPRAFLHALARKERDRTQREACPAISGQERVQLLFGLRREGVLQPHHRREHQPSAEGGQRGVRLQRLSLPGRP